MDVAEDKLTAGAELIFTDHGSSTKPARRTQSDIMEYNIALQRLVLSWRNWTAGTRRSVGQQRPARRGEVAFARGLQAHLAWRSDRLVRRCICRSDLVALFNVKNTHAVAGLGFQQGEGKVLFSSRKVGCGGRGVPIPRIKPFSRK